MQYSAHTYCFYYSIHGWYLLLAFAFTWIIDSTLWKLTRHLLQIQYLFSTCSSKTHFSINGTVTIAYRPLQNILIKNCPCLLLELNWIICLAACISVFMEYKSHTSQNILRQTYPRLIVMQLCCCLKQIMYRNMILIHIKMK